MAAPPNVKMLIAERDGVELEFQEELPFIPQNMPFSDTDYDAENVNDAITETSSKSGQSRYIVTSGYESTVQNGRWLEFHRGNPSDDNPFIVTEMSEVTSLSAAVPTSVTTLTITFYKNAILADTLVFTSSDQAIKVLTTPIELAIGDTWSMQKSAGDNAASINCYTHIKVNF